MIFYDLSGGMESAAMVWLERKRIQETGACVRMADTGKQFPEMAASMRQIEAAINKAVIIVSRRITFDEFLFEKGGMIRKGTTDCSRRMKRSNLMRHLKTFQRPYEVNIGFNTEEDDRADAFTDRNEREWLHWRFPLIEANISRSETREICKEAGFTILLDMYSKMGRFDCFMCGNQTPKQALKVIQHYPELAKEWMEMEARKGHSFMPVPLKVLAEKEEVVDLFTPIKEIGCSCFGGTENFVDEEE